MSGMSDLRAQIAALPAAHRRMLEAEWEGEVAQIHQEGLDWMDMLIRRRSGKMRSLYRMRANAKRLTASIGYVTKAAQRKAFYSRFVHDGTRRHAAKPWHDLAMRQGVPRMRRSMALLTERLHRRHFRGRS